MPAWKNKTKHPQQHHLIRSKMMTYLQIKCWKRKRKNEETIRCNGIVRAAKGRGGRALRSDDGMCLGVEDKVVQRDNIRS